MTQMVHKFQFDEYVPKGKYTGVAKRMFERKVVKEFSAQVGDEFYFDETPVYLKIIIEQAVPKYWTKNEKIAALEGKKKMVDKGPEQEKVAHLVLNALEGAAFVKRDQVCFLVIKKKYGKENTIEIQIGEYDGKN